MSDPNNTEIQMFRLLAELRKRPLTTLQARRELDIMHPAARVQKLRERGHNIITELSVIEGHRNSNLNPFAIGAN